MNLGAQKVKAWRRAQSPRLSQTGMAERFGLSLMTWSRIENGHQMPPLEQAVELQKAGVCDPGDFLQAYDPNYLKDNSTSPPQGELRGNGCTSVNQVNACSSGGR